ncbi:hypothetical protein HALOF300_05390 [Occultella aeris]|uniref:HNH nuclease domain-containing protein n=1 Tax=Occultella aeris TaxID=2761496 RepID=A0A7M4DT88_9MICO|nr:hypothetical protein HALOF300_05390 [Occultella aeris]
MRPHLGVLISYPEFLDLITTTQTAPAGTDGTGDKEPAADETAEGPEPGAQGAEAPEVPGAPGVAEADEAAGAAADEPPDAAEVDGSTAPPRPITEPLPGLDRTTTDPAQRSPRNSGTPITADQGATPASETGIPAEAPTRPSMPTGPDAPRTTDPSSDPDASTQTPTPTSATTRGTGANEPGASTEAPAPSSAPTGATTGPARDTSAPAEAPNPPRAPEGTGLPEGQSETVGPLGQPTAGTNGPAVLDVNGTAAPDINGITLPSTDVPGTDSTALPGTDGTALPGTAVAGTDRTAVPSAGRDWAVLLAAGPATFIDNTGPVPRDLLDRIIGCAGETYRIIFGPDNEILNHGRAHRLFTAAQRRAVIARDRHCIYHDCTAPPEHCETHHGTRDWADGGNTDLHDAALVCRYHHHLIHTHNITMLRRNGTWHFYKPDGTEILPTRNPWN